MTSADKGKTWAPWFDLMFRPAAASGAGLNGRKGDKVVLDDLDTQYQAVVKQNDVATMDRLLAEDFILVTGSGKTYTKADLLNEARSGRMRYSHQEDTDRTVRVWGAAAVVTAKLWEQGTDGGKSFD